MELEQLKRELKISLVDALNLEEVNVNTIADDTPLFGAGLGLDSIDALEIMLILERNYGIKMDNAQEARKVFANINTLAEYVATHRKK